MIPLVIFGLLAAHLGLLVYQKHTQFAGPGRTEKNVVGSPMYPNFILKTTGFMFMVTGVLWALGGLVQINPIWQFGPYQPDKISYAVQPDWYMGWLDGALRIMPSWEFAGFGHTIPFEVFLPAILFPGLTFGLFYAWPFVEAWLTGDHAEHQLARPTARQTEAHGHRRGFPRVLLLPLRGQLDRRARQLLPHLAQHRAVGVPVHRDHRADHRRAS